MSEDDTRRDWLKYWTVGLEFAATFLLGLAVGIWLDGLYGPPPAYTLTLGAVGFGIALYRLLRQAFDLKRKEDVRKRDRIRQDAQARVGHAADKFGGAK